jgi:hypothetical protein
MAPLALFTLATTTQPTNVLEAVDKFHGFYSTAWGQLLQFLAIAFGIVGILVPTLLILFQTKMAGRQARAQKEDFLRDSNAQLEKAKADMLSTFQKEQEALDEKIDREVADARGGLFHLQGSILCERDEFVDATRNFVRAALEYATANAAQDLRSVFTILAVGCFPKIAAADFAGTKVRDGLLAAISRARESDIWEEVAADAGLVEAALKEALERA